MGNKTGAKKPDLTRVIKLQSFLQYFHDIERVVHLSKTTNRRETDTEHSYSLAIIAWYLAQYFPELDTNLCIRYSLVHDLVEIHAGDTYIFDEAMLQTKVAREHDALIKIEEEWPDFPEMSTDIRAYIEHASPESCFVYALDKVMPIIVIFLGGGHTWHEYDISLKKLEQDKRPKVMKSPQVLHYYDALMKMLKDYPDLFPKSIR
jgi:putative hydrolases of HD superfamily